MSSEERWKVEEVAMKIERVCDKNPVLNRNDSSSTKNIHIHNAMHLSVFYDISSLPSLLSL